MFVYKITNQINGKICTGQTICEINERMGQVEKTLKHIILKNVLYYMIAENNCDHSLVVKICREIFKQTKEFYFKYI